MTGLTTALLGRACRIFLALAYPGGAIPPKPRVYWDMSPEQPLDTLLLPPVCQPLPAPGGGVRGYALRLGSAAFPHLKLQVVYCDHDAPCVFAVDTHDALRQPLPPPDAERWAQLQAANRQVKEQIERAWEAAGLLTFNGLLRRELAKPHEPKAS
jgi:hypothetical protein